MPPNFRDNKDSRCINCGLSTRRGSSRVKDLTPAERQLLSTWLQCYVIPDFESSSLCNECGAYIQKYANPPQSDQAEAPATAAALPRWLGHGNVCATCGMSTLRKNARPSLVDEERFPFQKMMRPYMQHYKEGKAEICRPCNEKCKRLFDKAHKPLKDPTTEEQVLQTDDEAELIPSHPDMTKDSIKTLELPSYSKLEVPKKLACIACGGAEVGRVRLKTRQQLMLRRKLYTPSGARVCARHAAPDSWPAAAPDTQPCEFFSEQIADMIFLLKFVSPADLGDLQSLAPYTRKKWLGVTLETFEEILNQTPKLLEHKGGRFALAVYLASRNSGECPTVLASLCQRPLELIESAVELARECVDLDAPPRACEEQ